MNDPDKRFSHCVLRNWDSGDEPCAVEGEPLTLGPQTLLQTQQLFHLLVHQGHTVGRSAENLLRRTGIMEMQWEVYLCLYMYVCVYVPIHPCVCMCAWMFHVSLCVCTCSQSWTPEVSDPLELDLQVVVSWPTQLLGIKLRSSGRIIRTL